MNKITGPQDKVWGQTTRILLGSSYETHYMVINKGGFCSEHQHIYKWNRFFVISGKLKVTVFDKENKPVHHILTAEQYMDIPPKNYHKFEALEDTVCIEGYWTDILEPNDILRRTEGGLSETHHHSS